MPNIRDSKLESPSKRAQAFKVIRKKPYWLRIDRGIKLGYRRNQTGGTWSVEATDGHGKEWIRKFAVADDHDKANGETILNFWQAQERAKKIARGETGTGAGSPVTVDQALTNYENVLKGEGADPANATRVRKHLSPVLKAKCVLLLTVQDMLDFRQGLVNKGLKPGGVNRCTKCLRAALNFAAASDTRIVNTGAWKIGLAGLLVGNTARKLVKPDGELRRIVAAAYQNDLHFGRLIETLAATGCRASQAARLRVGDLQAEHSRVMLPSTKKGGRKAAAKKRTHIPTKISTSLLAQLQAAAGDREPDALLLLQANGKPWETPPKKPGGKPRVKIDVPMRAAVIAAELDGDAITSYVFRHSSIVRNLKRGLSASVVGPMHDTSEAEIRRHYAFYIADHLDDLATVVDFSPAAVVTLDERRDELLTGT